MVQVGPLTQGVIGNRLEKWAFTRSRRRPMAQSGLVVAMAVLPDWCQETETLRYRIGV